MDEGEFIFGLLIWTILIFMLFRKVLLWYWKINIRVKLEEEINESLKEIKELLTKEKE